jgi:hypothetical protein
MIDEVTYHLVAQTMAIQFKDILTEHFSPHQFGVLIHGEIVVHGV